MGCLEAIDTSYQKKACDDLITNLKTDLIPLHGMTFPFLSDRKPLWIPLSLNQTSRQIFLFPKQ